MLDSLTLLRAMNGIHEEDVVMAGNIYLNEKKSTHRKTRRVFAIALAAALLLALGGTAYAVWSIHEARQSELKENLKIAENHAESYVEYPVPEENGDGMVLLSAVNDGETERIYVNIAPVTEAEASAFPESTSFAWFIDGTEIGGFAAPQLPVELSLSGTDEIRAAVLEHAYNKETQTMTLQCYLDVNLLSKAAQALGTDEVPLAVSLRTAHGKDRSFGPISFTMTEKQQRSFDFGRAQYHDKALDKSIEILGLELTPFSAVWKVRYADAAAFHRPEADWTAYEPWSILEDKVCIESLLIFSDGTTFSTGGALTSPYQDGVVELHCGWGSAIDIDDVQRIVLGDLVLWEAE